MNDSEQPADAERLAALERENEELRRRLAVVAGKEEDIYSYRIFVEARKKFLTWIGVAILVISAFGVVSVASIIRGIKAQIEARGIESIVAEIKQDFEAKHQGDIIDGTITRLLPTIQGKVEEVVRTELLGSVQRAQKVARSRAPADTAQAAFAQALEKTYEEERYFVVAGSSPLRSDLVGELQRVQTAVGSQFTALFPLAKICPPAKGNRNYALVIGEQLPFKAAKQLQEEAVAKGFREDTFLRRATQAYFECR